MPLTPLLPQGTSVVGMSGTPVSGGAGIKPPIFRNDLGTKFFSLGRTPPQLYDEREIDSYEQQGLLARTEHNWDPVDAGVILYAHRQFIDPGIDRLKLDSSKLRWDEKLGIWVTYDERDKALRWLLSWGNALIRDAKEHLQRAAKKAIGLAQPLIERALDNARRARFCAPPPEHAALREEAFACWAAAWILQGRPIKPLLHDAQRDFPHSQTLERIEATARRLATPESPTYPARKPNERTSWGRPAT